MTPRLPLVIDDRLLTGPELRAAALDGELGAIGAAFAITDLPPTAEARAASLAGDLPDRAILADRTAAWVWGWTIERPSPPRLCVSMSARIASPSRRALRAREVVIEVDEIRDLAGTAVTSPERTLIDIARFDEGADAVELLAAGISAADLEPDAVLAALDRRPAAAGRRRARERLVAALALASALAEC